MPFQNCLDIGRDENVSKMDVDGQRPTSTRNVRMVNVDQIFSQVAEMW